VEVCQNDSYADAGTVRNGALKYFRVSPPPPDALKIATLSVPSALIFSNAYNQESQPWGLYFCNTLFAIQIGRNTDSLISMTQLVGMYISAALLQLVCK
jgi:hypothetical protein